MMEVQDQKPTDDERLSTSVGLQEDFVEQELLNNMNVPGMAAENRSFLHALGGVDVLIQRLHVDIDVGLTTEQVCYAMTMTSCVIDTSINASLVNTFGRNLFVEAPMKPFLQLFVNTFKEFTLMILIAAAIVSLILGITVEDSSTGWIEGTAILVTVLIVSTVAALNDYTNELQFRALEHSAHADELCTVLRNGAKQLINPSELTVGDIVILQVGCVAFLLILQKLIKVTKAGDGIPADGVVVDNNIARANESSLTGESSTMKKSKQGDPFLLSSCTIAEAEEIKMMVTGIGAHSQWGRIQANLVTEPEQTPLQVKLDDVAKSIGYLGAIAAAATFAVMFIYIFVYHHPVLQGTVTAFVLAVTIVVVAIPEGLPLAVTIALAYSTRRMYKDQNLVRVLSACETMGNATDICSDKTGTLTENRMTVVEGWMGDLLFGAETINDVNHIPVALRHLIGEHLCINRLAYFVTANSAGQALARPEVVGNATEGALMALAKTWDMDYADVSAKLVDSSRDKIYAFTSIKKRSSAVVHMPDGIIRVFCKGASEYILQDCTHYSLPDGTCVELTPEKREQIAAQIVAMANKSLRTLCIAHRDFLSPAELPADWQETAPDSEHLCCDAIVGIIDPLRPDVTEAVRIAQHAGITVRMVTGDNINTACAIARQCGILTENGIALEGPVFRNMTPVEVDDILPRLQVLARSSPEDKLLLVNRLNGTGLPDNRQEWEAHHVGYNWDKDRDLLLPGYREEWASSRPYGGQIVGVTGDGTNDAPALKAGDVGLSMGVTGTKIAKNASDIVILDDKFSSIVRAIVWGRSVYDNVRKFLQFQLTVNVVACLVVFIGAIAGFNPPLNAVMMLWVNMIMDSLGALALATEIPTDDLLDRKPYKRSAALINKPMIRHIGAQSVFQLVLMMILLFVGASLFGVEEGSRTHFTIIFNAFVFCQLFNEFNCLSLTDDWNVFKTFGKNPVFIIVWCFTAGVQAVIVEFGGVFTETTGLTGLQWLITILLGAIALPMGVLMRFIPIQEDPHAFFDHDEDWQKFMLRRKAGTMRKVNSRSFLEGSIEMEKIGNK